MIRLMLLMALLLFACEGKEQYHHGSWWIHTRAPCAGYTWAHVESCEAQEFFGLMQGSIPVIARVQWSDDPAGKCIVYSIWSEEQSKHLVPPFSFYDKCDKVWRPVASMDGWSVHDHEVKGHVETGDEHPIRE